MRQLRGAGHVAYLAGGCVRDELLGQHPTDYDVATDAPPLRISELFPRTAEVGASFGVVLVKSSGVSVEVATFRSDGPYSDRRRPDTVRFSDPRSDALRRDFTINALFLDPIDSTGACVPVSPGVGSGGGAAGGRVIDFVGGQADLRAKILRAVGDPDQRLSEDHLRALRAVRFTARLGFTIEPATWSALVRHAQGLEGVSRERIGDELRRMLLDPNRASAISLLQSLGLDAPVLQEQSLLRAPELVAAVRFSDDDATTRFACVLGAWALDRGLSVQPEDTAASGGPKPGSQRGRTPGPVAGLVSRWRSALCLSNDEVGLLSRVLVTLGELEHRWASAGVAARKRLASAQIFPESLRILRAKHPEMAAAVDSDLRLLAATPSGLAPEPLITGDVLIEAGMKAGPAFKATLDGVYDAQLEDRVTTRSEALDLAFRIARGSVR